MSALADVRVVEITGQYTPIAGRTLAELGADVVVVEPVEGSPHRHRPPFVDDELGADRSLRWWAGNVGKRSVTIDLNAEVGVDKLHQLIATADVVLAGSDRVASGALSYREIATAQPALIWVSLSPFGVASARADDPVTDLTVLAGGGPVWNCGYDDHSIAPMRGSGDQSANIGGMYGTIGALVALSHRDHSGAGQFVDVNVTAACNVTCEQTTYHWLVNQAVCLRQTGRHAYPTPSSPVQVRCADGHYATTGVLPRKPEEFTRLVDWLTELDLVEELPETYFLELAADRAQPVDLAAIGEDDETTAILSAARDAVTLIASRLPAKEFFLASQRRGFAAGAILAPHEAFDDEHTIARGMHVQVEHPELGRTVTYPGAPYLFGASPTAVPTRAPLLGEHNALLDDIAR
ncbi:carnitine dehydratase [Mycobacterium intracellulare subsp. chimaera]|nr:CoA transferase [Mycobacterium intracellulare]ASW98594.1 carnitine dehydratase [Mycobacterium intracellulare subsp. chimaera]PBA61193.1 carnitine dehydratase [Mycobacterium intracellulare subsp. chimaera]PBA61421.1 carnitine dehydratase [Mycobacterium intracellulare subsp. chimaera]